VKEARHKVPHITLFIYMKYPEGANPNIESGCQVLGKESGEQLRICIGFIFWDDTNILKLDSGDNYRILRQC
jgi:hypothetical protein